jgi:hypothetical protein
VSNGIAKLLAGRADGPVEIRGAVLSRIDADGSCQVLMDGNNTPVAAKVLSTASGLQAGARLLVAIGVEPEPVVLGAIADAAPRQALSGKHLKLSAADSISIECGDSAITLRQDGTVVIRGKKVVSRASGENKLRGATVKIN